MNPTVNTRTPTTVFVGLSGGVDSAVTAALLKEQGHKVVGVFIKGWYPPHIPCTWAADRRDAMRVAARLGIPFRTLDASTEYKQAVIDYLVREYGAGRTPNPDVFCNRDVKFGAFYQYAKKEGAQLLATGHYARTTDGHLYRGKDETKDQSYFLWAVPQEVLAHVLFPLGEYTKKHVRTLARKHHLPVAEKKDSQGVCFLGNISMEEFLRSELPVTEGIAKDERGEKVGIHDGALLYTIGERVSLQGAPPGPWYVHNKDVEKNELVVSLLQQEKRIVPCISLTATNFFLTPKVEKQYTAQYRYHGPSVYGTYDAASAVFSPKETLQEYPPQGQSLVLYDGEACVGGGIIT